MKRSSGNTWGWERQKCGTQQSTTPDLMHWIAPGGCVRHALRCSCCSGTIAGKKPSEPAHHGDVQAIERQGSRALQPDVPAANGHRLRVEEEWGHAWGREATDLATAMASTGLTAQNGCWSSLNGPLLASTSQASTLHCLPAPAKPAPCNSCRTPCRRLPCTRRWQRPARRHRPRCAGSAHPGRGRR